MSVRKRILAGFGLVLILLVALGGSGIVIVSRIDADATTFRHALETKADAVEMDLLTTKVRVPVNQWLRSMNPDFAQQADRLLSQLSDLLRTVRAQHSGRPAELIDGVDGARKAYTESWAVVQSLYAQQVTVFEQKVELPGQNIRNELGKLRDALLTGGDVAAAQAIITARDAFVIAGMAALQYRTSSKPDNEAAVLASLGRCLAAIQEATPLMATAANEADLQRIAAAVRSWQAGFEQTTGLDATRRARLDSWTKNEGAAMAAGANTLRTEAEATAAKERATLDALIASSRLLLPMATLLAVSGGVLLSFIVARSVTGPLARVTGTMRLLASGDRTVNVPETNRHDEIGDLAKAAQVFKENALTIERVTAE